MVSIPEAVILAVVQGLTEWLPISSSGHLVILQQLLNIQASVAFDVMLHLGTLLAVVWFLREDISAILKAVLRFDFSSDEVMLGAYVIVGTIPIAIAGLLLKSFFESLFSNLTAVGVALFINGVFLYVTKFTPFKDSLNIVNSLFIGIAQAVSIIPGISRSGSTISAALIAGIDRKTAYKFSFLLSVLAILGASLVTVGEINFSQESWDIILIGVITSAIAGYFALKIITVAIDSDNFYKFAYYCWLVGLAIFLFSI